MLFARRTYFSSLNITFYDWTSQCLWLAKAFLVELKCQTRALIIYSFEYCALNISPDWKISVSLYYILCFLVSKKKAEIYFANFFHVIVAGAPYVLNFCQIFVSLNFCSLVLIFFFRFFFWQRPLAKIKKIFQVVHLVSLPILKVQAITKKKIWKRVFWLRISLHLCFRPLQNCKLLQ